MRIIQYLLILSFVLTVLVYFKRWRNRLRDRLLLLGFALAGSLVVLFPDVTANLALLTGVGRGVDLVMYLSIAGLSFFSFLLYAHIRETDRKLTELTRAIAIKTAKHDVSQEE